MATLRQAFPSKYLKADDLGGASLQATVKLASMENIQIPGSASEPKVVLYFQGGVKPLILNATNFKAMVEITGQPDSDNWNGAKVQLVKRQAAFGGKVYDAIRIKSDRVTSTECEQHQRLHRSNRY